MPDRSHRREQDIARCTLPPDAEKARRMFASARADDHSVRELYLLELAVRAPDDESARQLEVYAHEAYCDAHAIAEEHGLDD